MWWNKLLTIVDEAQVTLLRTAFSRIVTEAWDFSCALFDTKGEMIAQGRHGLPAFLGCMAQALHDFLAAFPPETLQPGDSLITTDPWIGASQINDVFFVTPIFHRGRIVAYAMSVSHSPDVGGRLLSADSKEVFEEGFRLPIMKLFRAGEPNEDLFRIIRLNVRVPDIVVGDLMAQLASNTIMARRLVEFLEAKGLDDADALFSAVWERSDLAMRQAIAKIPPGTYRGEVETDGFDQPITLRCAITVKSDEIHVDCEGTSPQQEHGINCTKRWSFAEVAHACICVAHPSSPVNGATLKRITYSVPEGTVINATYPAALGARALVAMYLQGMIFRTLGAGGARSRHRRDRDAAASVGLHGPRQRRAALRRHHVSERRARRQADHGWRVVDRLAGKHRGHPGGGDREREAPAVPRQGARHRFRRRRPAARRPRRRVWRCDRRRASRSRSACASTASTHPALGLFGGKPGGTAAVSVNGKPVHSKKTLALATGDVYAARCAGGAGYGDPHERPPETVLRDVRGGYVSAGVARNDYGVALTAAGDAVDAEGTRRLRKRR